MLPKITRFLIIIIEFRASIKYAFASHSCSDTGTYDHLCNPTTAQNIIEILNVLVAFLLTYGLPFVVVFMVIAGFLFVTARGNEEQLARAKTMFFWTVIGAAIIVGAKIIAEAIANLGDALAA